MELGRQICSLLFVGVFLSLGMGCGKVSPGCDSENSRQAIVDGVNNALNKGNCIQAKQAIDPFYGLSGCGTDPLRYAEASAYSCIAGVNFFDMIANLGTNAAGLVGNMFWRTLSKLFPSTLNDGKVPAGEIALDALFAAQIVGSVTPSNYIINSGTQNPGSLLVANRQDDSNLFSMLTSMAMIGEIQNEYGAPNATFQKTKNLGETAGNVAGWGNPLYLTQDGCAYAGSILTMLDGMASVGTSLGTATAALTNVGNTLNALIGLACDAGCTNTTTLPTGCHFPVGQCNPCPITLRYRNSCTPAVTSLEACAAAGIIDFINHNPVGWN